MVNLLPLKTGGGVQVALDFLRQAAMYGVNHEWFIVVRKDSQFLNVELSDNMQIVYSVPDNLLARLYFEYFGCKSLIQQYEVDAVYTQFGPTGLVQES
jgi:hypothetical protein